MLFLSELLYLKPCRFTHFHVSCKKMDDISDQETITCLKKVLEGKRSKHEKRELKNARSFPNLEQIL